MLLENLKIGRVVMHEVFKREDKRPMPPSYAERLEVLPPKAMGEFQIRITQALSAQAKSLEMQVARNGDGSHLAHVQELLDSHDDEFLKASRKVADGLVEAQTNRNVPGGMLVVFDGQAGVPARRFVGVIKAEVHSGFRRRHEAEMLITEFLNDIFLSPAQRLYKVGLLVETKPGLQDPEGWSAFVFDSNISQSHREGAAQYFYETFLGCTFPDDGPYETARFFELTREFVKKSEIPVEQKRDLNDALYSFIKTDQAKTFTADEFADNYMPLDMRDAFSEFMGIRKFPKRAIVRDVSVVGPRLRRRRFRFGSDIEFSVSPEALSEKRATIESGPAQEFGGHEAEIWTRITVHQSITDER